MRHQSLSDWLSWQQTLHPKHIDLRLERVIDVWSRLGPAHFPCPVITVGGTNGKGSCVGYLDHFYRAAGYRTCAFTSPHLLHYNERIRIDGHDAVDADICASFARIDATRGTTRLTYFEFNTLAALDLFVRAEPDVVILEVGMGGRLDAVNVIDPDVAVVTNVGIDHVAWLGDNPDQIAVEKAGIFRRGRPAVIGQRQSPPRLRERAMELGAEVFQLGREFDHRIEAGQWHWQGPDEIRRGALPAPALRGRFQYDNASAALCATALLETKLPLAIDNLRQGLLRTQLQGRFTVFPGEITRIFDVAHNADAARALAANLGAYPCSGKRHAVLSLLADKDALTVTAALSDLIDDWHVAPMPSMRTMSADQLRAVLTSSAPGRPISCHADIGQAIAGAEAVAKSDDCILVFGSFMAVEAGLRKLGLASV